MHMYVIWIIILMSHTNKLRSQRIHILVISNCRDITVFYHKIKIYIYLYNWYDCFTKLQHFSYGSYFFKGPLSLKRVIP
jgi:hypothetical protein